MTNEKIVVGIDNQVIELQGEQLAAFLAQREIDNAEVQKNQELLEAELNAKLALKQSAKQKLALLGLTDEEIKVLIDFPTDEAPAPKK